MNLKHLGDAFDHWKGSVIELVGEMNLRVVNNLQVVPMFTDQEPWPWGPENLATYAKLLRRQVNDILKRNDPFSNSRNDREAYFKNLGQNDLFLDPDTGIAGNQNAMKEHVKASEVACLLSASPRRMLLVYQHKGQREKMRKTHQRVLEGLREFHAFTYDSGQVGMVFISRDQKRLAEALARIQVWLGPVAETRIIR